MRDGLATKEDLEAILDEQRDTRQQRVSGRRLGEILIERGAVTQTQVARLVAEHVVFSDELRRALGSAPQLRSSDRMQSKPPSRSSTTVLPSPSSSPT